MRIMREVRLLGTGWAVALGAISFGAQGTPAANTLAYQFAAGDTAHYALSFRTEAKEVTANGTRAGTLEHSFGVGIGAMSGGVHGQRVRVNFEQCDFGEGDSAPMCQAVLHAQGMFEIQRNGELAGEPEMIGTITNPAGFETPVTGSIQDVAVYVTIPVSSDPVKVGDTWEIEFPIRFVGGLYSGRISPVELKATLASLEETGGETRAHMQLMLSHLPKIELSGDSASGANFDYQVPVVSGEMVFSLDKHQLVSLTAHVETEMKATLNGEVQMDHNQKYDVSVTRKQ